MSRRPSSGLTASTTDILQIRCPCDCTILVSSVRHTNWCLSPSRGLLRLYISTYGHTLIHLRIWSIELLRSRVLHGHINSWQSTSLDRRCTIHLREICHIDHESHLTDEFLHAQFCLLELVLQSSILSLHLSILILHSLLLDLFFCKRIGAYWISWLLCLSLLFNFFSVILSQLVSILLLSFLLQSYLVLFVCNFKLGESFS